MFVDRFSAGKHDILWLRCCAVQRRHYVRGATGADGRDSSQQHWRAQDVRLVAGLQEGTDDRRRCEDHEAEAAAKTATAALLRRL